MRITAVALRLKMANEIEDLRLGRHIRAVVGSSYQDARLGGKTAIITRWRRPPDSSKDAVDPLEAWNADHRQELDRPVARRLLAEVGMQADRLDELVADGVKGRERAHRLLEDIADFAAADGAHLAPLPVEFHEVGDAAVLAPEQDLSAFDPPRPLDDPQDRAGRHALAATRFADDAQRVARLEIEGGTFDGPHDAFVLMEPGAQVADAQDWFDALSHRDPRHPSGRHRGS